MNLAVFSLALLGSWASLHADTDVLIKETNLEKRSQLALEHADKAIDQARQAYAEGELQSFKVGLTDAANLAQLSYKSLQDTGKAARKNPKFWKRAELKLRTLARRVDSLARDVSIEDRHLVQGLEKEIHQLHDLVLNDIMTKK